VPAIEEAFGADVDFAQLIKNYSPANTNGPDWFRPSAGVVSITTKEIIGNPNKSRIQPAIWSARTAQGGCKSGASRG